MRIVKPYLPREEAMRWWQYSRAKSRFQSELGEDVFVPSIKFALDSQKHVCQAVVWSMNESALVQVFPRCDYLLLAWDFDPDKQRKPRVRSIRIQDADRLQPLLEPIDGPVSDLKILRPVNRNAATHVFEALTTVEAETLELIGSDAFVDVLV